MPLPSEVAVADKGYMEDRDHNARWYVDQEGHVYWYVNMGWLRDDGGHDLMHEVLSASWSPFSDPMPCFLAAIPLVAVRTKTCHHPKTMRWIADRDEAYLLALAARARMALEDD